MSLLLHDPGAVRLELPELITAEWVMSWPSTPPGTRLLLWSSTGTSMATPAALRAMSRRLVGLHVGFTNCGPVAMQLLCPPKVTSGGAA